jgi:hypothetical protein
VQGQNERNPAAVHQRLHESPEEIAGTGRAGVSAAGWKRRATPPPLEQGSETQGGWGG